MAKLLPPLVESSIPAFYAEENAVSITIPFTMNQAVSPSAVKGFSIKIKTVQSSTYLYSVTVTDPNDFNLINEASEIRLNIAGVTEQEKQFLSKIKAGQFYKFQIAYIDIENNVGHFSGVTVGKYTLKPTVIIDNVERRLINSRSYSYTGVYSNNDIAERVYSYKFNLYDDNQQLCYTTGDQLHNSENDTIAKESYDSCDLLLELIPDKIYYIQYIVTTINNLVVSSSRYRIAQRETLNPDINTNLIAEINNEDGYIEISYDGETAASGSYMLMRGCSETNYEVWDKVHTFRLINNIPKNLIPFRDFTFEQGKSYKYCLVQYNKYNLYSNKIYSNEVYADFEHAFLFDGKRQLKIKYNPKVASLKATVLEQKVDTIGGQYPFIFRNGSVYYKEFSISGLISMLSDESGLFLEAYKQIDNLRDETPTLMDLEYKARTHPSAENFYKERNFKTEVINWLTDGNTKLFRSPGEGNYIVRLINTSLQPNDQLGRMLHTFTTSAYEIADFNHNNLIKYNFLRIAEDEDIANSTLYWKTIDLDNYAIGQQLNSEKVMTVSFTDMKPGDKIQILLQEKANPIEIVIGPTGEYTIDRITPIRSMKLKQKSSGLCTYSFYNTEASNFETISNIYYLDVPATQLIGASNDIREDLGLVWTVGEKTYYNPKMELVNIYYLKAYLRQVVPIYSKSRAHFYQSPFTADSPLVKPNPILLYHEIQQEKIASKINDDIFTITDKDYVVSSTFFGTSELYHDYNRWKVAGEDDEIENAAQDLLPTRYYYNSSDPNLAPRYDTTITFTHTDGTINVIDLAESTEFFTNKLTSLEKISVGAGVVIELGYQVKVTDYVVENKDAELKNQKNIYNKAIANLHSYVTFGDNNAIRDLYTEKYKSIKNSRIAIGKRVYTLLNQS